MFPLDEVEAAYERAERIVEHGEGPARLTGGFGTGKTTLLRRRGQRLRAGGARVLELRPPDLPAFAVGVLQRAGIERRLLGPAEHLDAIASVLPDHLRPMAAEVAGTVLAYQASFLGAEELFVHADAAGELDRAEELHRLTEAYLARLDAAGAVDEAGALVQASLLLRDPDALARERARFDFLHVDDFQLATFAANRLVGQLSGINGNVVVASNPDAAVGELCGTPITGSHLDAFARRFGAAADADVHLDGPSHRRPQSGRSMGDVYVLDHEAAARAVGKEWPAVLVRGATADGWLHPPPCPRYQWFDRAIFAGPDTPGDDERAERWQEECRRRFLVASSRATEHLDFAPGWRT